MFILLWFVAGIVLFFMISIQGKHFFRLDRFPLYLGLILLAFIGWMVSLEINGVNIELGQWQHTGYVSAVETSIIGVTRVYFKTDSSSSQEDVYCVKDEEYLIPILENASANSLKITLKYIEYFHGGLRCEDGFVITAIE